MQRCLWREIPALTHAPENAHGSLFRSDVPTRDEVLRLFHCTIDSGHLGLGERRTKSSRKRNCGWDLDHPTIVSDKHEPQQGGQILSACGT